VTEKLNKTYIVRINRWDSRVDILVDELDRQILCSIFRPGIQKSKQSLNLVVRVDVLCVRPPVRWDIVDATSNSSDDSKIVTSSLESPEEICVMKSVLFRAGGGWVWFSLRVTIRSGLEDCTHLSSAIQIP
jgi:hypothetical protein